MSETWMDYGRYIAAVLGAAATYLWGGWDAVLVALVAFAALDYVTGVAAAWTGRRLSSEASASGILRKLLMFAAVAVANILDGIAGLDQPMLRTLVIWFYLATEGISILENLAEAGLPIPEPLRQALQRLRGRGEGNEQSTG